MAEWRYRKPKQTAWQNWQQPSQPKGPPVNTVYGFDGKRRSLDLSTSQPSSSSSEPSVQELKDMLKRLSQGDRLSQEQLQRLESSPRTILHEEQKVLNQKRKQMNKQRNLQQRIADLKTKYKDWEKAQRKLLVDEKERYEETLQRLERELGKATQDEAEMTNAEEEGDPEATVDMATHHQEVAAMERRALQAEKVAWESQQTMLQLQAQMQQVMAYHHAHGMPSEAAPSAAPWTATSPGPGPAVGAESSSPQLPKAGKVRMDHKNQKEAIQVDSDGAEITEEPSAETTVL